VTGFRGADPAGLQGLAQSLEGRIPIIVRSANEVHLLLAAHRRNSRADWVGFKLSRVVRTLGTFAADLRRRAAMVRDADRLVPGGGVPAAVSGDAWWRAEYALIAPFGSADWNTGYIAWRDGPAPGSLVGLDPYEVHVVLGAISAHAHRRLVLAAPRLIGGLDGAPPELRYAANRVLLQREVVRLDTLAGSLDLEIAESEFDPANRHWAEVEREVLLDERATVDEQLERYRLWAREDRQILLFDPRGDGRVAEVFGDLATAEHIGVVVPGITNDIANFGPVDVGGFRENAADLSAAAGDLDDRVATVAWLGYDTPDGADAVIRRAAEAGHGDLRRFVAGLVAGGDRHITVIGHSYGSLVAGMAAGDGIAADEVVFIGSPGTSLDHAGDANLPPGGEVWAGLASWDPIGAGVSLVPSDPWEGTLSLPGRYVWDLITSGDLAAEDLWHGTNPAHESFGAIEFTTDGATGHSQYFDPGTESLENLARIVAGLSHRVTVLLSEPMELAPGPFGEPWIDPVAEVV
jgi:hypothetical protein